MSGNLGPQEDFVYKCKKCGQEKDFLAPGSVISKSQKCDICGGDMEIRSVFKKPPLASEQFLF